MKRILTVALIFVPSLVFADDSDAYQKAAESVVSVVVLDENGGMSRGTGVVVGNTILTARHVIANAKTIGVIFPRRDERGQIICDPAAYKEAVPCKLMATSVSRDLAFLLLQQPIKPRELTLLPFITPGSHVFSISAGSDGAMWSYAAGDVRQVYQGQLTPREGEPTKGKIVETTITIHPGNSGGPILNDKGELAGIMLATDDGKKGVCMGLATSEIVAFMNEAMDKFKVTPELPITVK
jgi:serine protease Do